MALGGVESGLLLEVALEGARRAGALVRASFGGRVPFRTKGARHDLVTEVDVRCQEAVAACIRERFPGHAVVGEESPPGPEPAAGAVVWLVDPIDGTTNFVSGIPLCCISVAASLDRELLAGVVLDPLRGEEFAATAGGGASLNGRPVRSSECAELGDAVVATDAAYALAHGARLRRVGMEARGVRMLGSAALAIAYVAAGRLDAYWSEGLRPWDAAAGALLVREAGGRVTGAGGREYEPADGPVLSSNGPLHDELARLVWPRAPGRGRRAKG